METILHTGLSNAVVASALALVAVLVGYFYRRPALIHGLWLLVLLKLLTPPLVPIPIRWPATPAPEPTASVVATPNLSDTQLSVPVDSDAPPAVDEVPQIVVQDEPPAKQPGPAPAPTLVIAETPKPFPWLALVAGVWLAGSASWFLLAGWRVLRFCRLLRFAVPAPETLRKTTERLARKMGLSRSPAVYLIPGRLAPMLWAAGGKPLLLVPCDLLAQLTREQLETLLTHELAHLRRRDHWVRGLEFMAMGLYWWHPVVWYARRELREAEEQCCDAWVVSLLPGAGKTYATALLETLDFLSDARPPTPLLASGIGQVSDLKRRLTMIMSGSIPRTLSWRGTFAMLALGLFALPLLPILAHAQTPEAQDKLKAELLKARVTLAAQQDAAQTQAELEQARAILAKLQAEVAATQARIKEIEARLAAPKGAKDPEVAKGKVIVMRVHDGQKGPTEIILRQVGDKWEVVQPPTKPQGNMTFRLVLEDGVARILPVDPTAKGEPKPQTTPYFIPTKPAPAPVKPGQDGRLEKLELQLQQIMKELEALRKEMKQPGKPGGGPGPKPVDPRSDSGYGKGAGIELRLDPFKPMPENPTPKPESR